MDFFKGALQKNRGSTPAQQRPLAKWHLRPDPRSDVIARQSEYRAHVSDGAGQPPEFLPVAEEQQPVEEEMEVRSGDPTNCFGASPPLRLSTNHRGAAHRRGMQINHKRVVRIMREDNLLGLQPQRFKGHHQLEPQFEVYLNLAASDEAERDQSALG